MGWISFEAKFNLGEVVPAVEHYIYWQGKAIG